jgi:hypothetical protein
MSGGKLKFLNPSLQRKKELNLLLMQFAVHQFCPLYTHDSVFGSIGHSGLHLFVSTDQERHMFHHFSTRDFKTWKLC